jgi:hypothetical protein
MELLWRENGPKRKGDFRRAGHGSGRSRPRGHRQQSTQLRRSGANPLVPKPVVAMASRPAPERPPPPFEGPSPLFRSGRSRQMREWARWVDLRRSASRRRGQRPDIHLLVLGPKEESKFWTRGTAKRSFPAALQSAAPNRRSEKSSVFASGFDALDLRVVQGRPD